MRVLGRRRIAASILGAAAAVLSAAGSAQGQAPGEDARRVEPSRQAQPVQESEPRSGVLGRIADGVLQVFAEGRLRAHVNGAYQSSSRQSEIVTTFRAYGEEARVETREEFQGGGHVDVGAALRVWRALELGGGYTQVSSAGTAVVTATVPHPLDTGNDRTAREPPIGLPHRQRATHLHLAWRLSLSDRLDVQFSAGPTYFHLLQGVVVVPTASETSGPPFAEVDPRVDRGEHARNGGGYNAGVDLTFMVSSAARIPRVGVGFFARMTGGSVSLPIDAGRSRRVSVGGFQTGAGLRLLF